MGRVNSEAAALLVAGICRGKFWASPEETERWLKTETGQRIAALIEKERRKHKNSYFAPIWPESVIESAKTVIEPLKTVCPTAGVRPFYYLWFEEMQEG